MESSSHSSGRGMKRKAYVLNERPREIKIVDYAQSRASEIEALTAQVRTSNATKQVFQSLTIHMRRRAMSHNIKRLPRRLQQIAKPEYEKASQQTHTAKRPSRKHRRRPKNLLAEYQRRQRKHIWMETHIWHAKRFKMEDRWGYRIPLHSTDKSIKASYRATQNYCQIQDLSYMCCIEIDGKEQNILTGLSHLTNTQTGLTFAAKANISGTREGQTVIYKHDRYPYDAIGCVSYLWKPVSNQNNSEVTSRRQIWIWCHPSCFSELWEQLKVCFEYKADDMEFTESKSEEDPENLKLSKIAFSSGDVTVTSLKDMLNRHRLTGPAANQILYQVMKPANILKKDSSEQHWWQKYYQKSSLSLGYTQQGEFMESLNKTLYPGEYMPHAVVGLTVGDPRISRPDKRTKVQENTDDIEMDNNICKEKLIPDVSLSALWYSDIRDEVKRTKMSDQSLNELKSDIFVPGSLPDLGIEESRIPVILIQRPGVRQGTSLNCGSGWDVILPQNWSMAFWLAFVYRGARAAGIRDLESLAFEQKVPYFPNDYPDTSAGLQHEQTSAERLKNKFDKRPPAKRCNYNKLGIAAPFLYPWVELLTTWNDVCDNLSNENIYVLRDRKVLKLLSQVFSTKTQLAHKKNFRVGSARTETIDEIGQVVKDHKFSLVHVEVAVVSRGVPDDHAIICIPTQEDMKLLQKDQTYSGPREPVHTDVEKLKKKKKKVSEMQQTEQLNSTFKKSLRNSCSREIIGFINRGGFSFGSGSGRGQGFCTTLGLHSLLQKTISESPVIVLVRNPTSYQYRFAHISVQ